MCYTPGFIINHLFRVKLIILKHSTSKLIFWAPKNFWIYDKAYVFCLVIFVTFEFLGKIVQNHDSGKTVSRLFPNLLVWYVYGHNPRGTSLVYRLAKLEEQNIL